MKSALFTWDSVPETPTDQGARRTVFEDALLEARDVFASVLAHAWRRMSPYDGFAEALAAMLAVAGERHGPRVQRIFRDAFAARGIEPGTSP
jgi:hypothetical protein